MALFQGEYRKILQKNISQQSFHETRERPVPVIKKNQIKS
jgi:hypothetical protein